MKNTKSAAENVLRMVDRGLITTNEAREIFDFPPVDGGDERYIRLEYGAVGGETNAET